MRIIDWKSDVGSSDLPPLDDTGLVMRKLDDSRQCLVASPGLISSPVTSPVDLSRFPSLDLGPVRPDYLWELESADGQKASVPHAPRIITDDMPTLRAAALEGLGIVQLPTLLIWPEDRKSTRLNSSH